MRKQTRWLTCSKEIADVLRGDGRWKRVRKLIHMSQPASKYLASLVVTTLSAIKCQMTSDRAIRVGELHFAGPEPDEGDYPTELEGTWRIDGTWIDPKLVDDGREEEMKYVKKHGLFEVIGEKECHDNGCNPLTLKWVDKMKEIQKAKNKDEHLGPEDVFSPLPSEGVKMLVSTMMTGHDDGKHTDGPIETATWIKSVLVQRSPQVDLHVPS